MPLPHYCFSSFLLISLTFDVFLFEEDMAIFSSSQFDNLYLQNHVSVPYIFQGLLLSVALVVTDFW